jgi:hypothetical protein
MKLDLSGTIAPPPAGEWTTTEQMSEVLAQRLMMLTPEQVNEYFMGEATKVYRWATELARDGVCDIDVDDMSKIEGYLNKGNHGIFLFAYVQMLEAIKEAKSTDT